MNPFPSQKLGPLGILDHQTICMNLAKCNGGRRQPLESCYFPKGSESTRGVDRLVLLPSCHSRRLSAGKSYTFPVVQGPWTRSMLQCCSLLFKWESSFWVLSESSEAFPTRVTGNWYSRCKFSDCICVGEAECSFGLRLTRVRLFVGTKQGLLYRNSKGNNPLQGRFF